MLAEFDPKQHVFFAMPFTKTMTTEFGSEAMLGWVSEFLRPRCQLGSMTADALFVATSALADSDVSTLRILDENAWSLWRCGDVPGKWQQKSICRFNWAVMGHLCYTHNHAFHCSANLEYTGRTEDQIQFIYRQAASAINLVFDLELAHNRTNQLELAKHFSLAIDRLESAG